MAGSLEATPPRAGGSSSSRAAGSTGRLRAPRFALAEGCLFDGLWETLEAAPQGREAAPEAPEKAAAGSRKAAAAP